MVSLRRIDHVQQAMPRAEEAKARAFYGDLLGMTEVPKPDLLRSRGGAWFRSGDVELHLGVEDDFRAARKAHVAIALSAGDGEVLKQRIVAQGFRADEDTAIPGFKRYFTDDCFGNRLEFICED